MMSALVTAPNQNAAAGSYLVVYHQQFRTLYDSNSLVLTKGSPTCIVQILLRQYRLLVGLRILAPWVKVVSVGISSRSLARTGLATEHQTPATGNGKGMLVFRLSQEITKGVFYSMRTFIEEAEGSAEGYFITTPTIRLTVIGQQKVEKESSAIALVVPHCGHMM
jgi:hypothetical protein|mmetsp:Transcript_123550/g.192945  ORF Transcript_123550/g.192945 Transcript_123550/m.192945 type:complete len:165 (+) Transcript_123550:33-527(+)